MLALNSLIDGHARTFLESLSHGEKDTVDKIRELLKTHFEGDSWLWGIESKLLSRKQTNSESLDNYASDIMLWGRQTKKTDSELRSLFVRGLLPTTRAFVMSKQPNSFRAALEAARLGITVQTVAEEQTQSNSHNNGTAKTQISNVCPDQSSFQNPVSLVHNVSQRLETVENRPTYVFRSGKQHRTKQFVSNRSIVCHRCGYTGH